MKGSGSQRRASYRSLLILLWVTLPVFGIELSTGWMTQSLTLLSATLCRLVSIFSLLISLFAVASPYRTLGKEIWGYGKREVTLTLLTMGLLSFSGLSIILSAVNAIADTTNSVTSVDISRSIIGLIALAAVLPPLTALLITLRLSPNRSLALKLSIRHLFIGTGSTALMLFGITAQSLGQTGLDPILAVVLVAGAFVTFWQATRQLLPTLVEPIAVAPEAIARLANRTEGVTRCTRIVTRGVVGRHIWIELHITLHPEYRLIASHIGEKIEQSLRERYGPVRARIWLDPAEMGNGE